MGVNKKKKFAGGKLVMTYITGGKDLLTQRKIYINVIFKLFYLSLCNG